MAWVKARRAGAGTSVSEIRCLGSGFQACQLSFLTNLGLLVLSVKPGKGLLPQDFHLRTWSTQLGLTDLLSPCFSALPLHLQAICKLEQAVRYQNAMQNVPTASLKPAMSTDGIFCLSDQAVGAWPALLASAWNSHRFTQCRRHFLPGNEGASYYKWKIYKRLGSKGQRNASLHLFFHYPTGKITILQALQDWAT